MSETYQKSTCIYEGKASRLFEAMDHPEYLIIERKDDITKLDGKERSQIEGKGSYTNRISNVLFRYLETEGIATHFVEELSPNETLIRRTTPLMMEVIVRNIATGSLCRKYPFKDGKWLDFPIVEFDYKSDQYGDPLINDDHALALGLVEDVVELEEIKGIVLAANDCLVDFFSDVDIDLVDMKLELGRTPNNDIIIIDEISPDTCRFWKKETGESLDKDIFRKGGKDDDTLVAYRTIFEYTNSNGK